MESRHDTEEIKDRRRRADRYKNESGVQPSGELIDAGSLSAKKNPAVYLPDEVRHQPRSTYNAERSVVRTSSPCSRNSETPRNFSQNGEEKKSGKKQEKSRGNVPSLLIVTTVLLTVAVLVLFTLSWNMISFIAKQEQEREDAYKRVVDAHPIYYKDDIEEYADRYNLNPAFVCAVVLNESSFRADAQSAVGARGLMQVMPDTAEWIAGKLKVTPFRADMLYDPSTNLNFGCWYLSYLANMFDGDPVKVISSYHTGQGQVKSWLQNRSVSPDGMTLEIESLPEGPTKKYVKKVTADYGIYKALFYPDETAEFSGGNDAGNNSGIVK